MQKCKICILSILFFSNSIVFTQENRLSKHNIWFVSLDLGAQMSGIKSEDFISSNYSPMVRFLGGKWFNSRIGVQIGYQGRYFNAIADNDKHFYDFYFIEGVINAKNIISSSKKDKKFHELLFHAGAGLFQNNYYGSSNFHGILGATNNFTILKNIKIKFDIGAIVGWDIYQGDDDILPNISLGVIYSLN